MLKHALKNPDGLYGGSPVVFPTFIRDPKTKEVFLAIFTQNEVKRALERGERYGTTELKDGLVKGSLSKLEPSL